MQGRNNRAANVVERAVVAPICRNISKATKVTIAEGISSAANNVLIQSPCLMPNSFWQSGREPWLAYR